MELEQIEADFPDYVRLEKGKIRSVYRIKYRPSDPDWVSEMDLRKFKTYCFVVST